MLRLRPSEIALTPVDVEETRRRIATKQAATPPVVLSSLSTHPALRGPRLRRGPARSRVDAIQHLGPIPVLTPHYVVHTSTDSDTADAQLTPRGNLRQGPDRGHPSEPASPGESGAEQASPSPSLVRGLQLPFRPAPPGDPSRSRAAFTRDVDTNPVPLPNRASQAPNAAGNRDEASELHSGSAPGSRLQSAADGANDARTPSQKQAAQGHGNATVSPRELDQAVSKSRPSIPQRRGSKRAFASKNMPTVLLQGYFVSTGKYTFRESYMTPHTEPRKRSGRFVPRSRSMSCSSEPSHSIPALHPRRCDPQLPGDIFGPAVATETPPLPKADLGDTIEQPECSKARSSFEDRVRKVHTRLESLQGRTRGFFGRARDGNPEPSPDEGLVTNIHPSRSERFSEVSSASSQPYSYYELPASRQSSCDGSQSQEFSQSQFDGAAPSRQGGRGAYFSIRPSQAPTKSDVSQPALTRGSSFSSPDLPTTLGQHGLSPCPASPYTRAEGTQDSTRPSAELITPDDFVGPNRDAARAAARDLSSPLDLLAQRAYIQLAQAPAVLPAGPANQETRVTSAFQYHVQDFDSEGRARQSGVGAMRQESGNSAHYRRLHTGRQQRDIGSSEQLRRRQERSSTNISEPQPYRRAVQGVRAGQRSSENVPVGLSPTPIAMPPPRVSQVQAHRVGYGNAGRPRTSQGITLRGGDVPAFPAPVRLPAPRPYPPSNREIPIRTQGRPPTRTGGRRPNRSLDESNTTSSSSPNPSAHPALRRTSQRYVQGAASARVRRSLTTSGTHSSDSENALHRHENPGGSNVPPRYHYNRHAHHRGPSPQHPQYHGPVALTSLAHTNARRPPIPVRVASRRRISARQRNQENAGEVEAELMREELGTVGMRYGGEGGGGDVMNETPPGIGRFERRMLGE